MQNNMKMYAQPTLPFGEDESTSLRADSHASRSASRENEKELTMSATCGRQCLERFAQYSHVGSWAKTFSELLIGLTDWSSSRCALTWKMKGTKYNRTFFQLAVSTLPTGENGRGLLLKTPSAFDATVTSPKKNPKSGNSGSLAQEIMCGYATRKRGLLFTPQIQGLKKCENRKTVFFPLNLIPTPEANDYRSGMQNRYGTKHTQQLNDTIAYHAGKTSQLNPRFVAEMMGFPTDWTESPFRNGDKSR